MPDTPILHFSSERRQEATDNVAMISARRWQFVEQDYHVAVCSVGKALHINSPALLLGQFTSLSSRLKKRLVAIARTSNEAIVVLVQQQQRIPIPPWIVWIIAIVGLGIAIQ